MTQNLSSRQKEKNPFWDGRWCKKFPSFSFGRVTNSLLTQKRLIYSKPISFRIYYKEVRPVWDLFSPICKHLLTWSYTILFQSPRGDSWGDECLSRKIVYCQPDVYWQELLLESWLIQWWFSTTGMWPNSYIRSGLTFYTVSIYLNKHHCNISYCQLVTEVFTNNTLHQRLMVSICQTVDTC